MTLVEYSNIRIFDYSPSRGYTAGVGNKCQSWSQDIVD